MLHLPLPSPGRGGRCRGPAATDEGDLLQTHFAYIIPTIRLARPQGRIFIRKQTAL